MKMWPRSLPPSMPAGSLTSQNCWSRQEWKAAGRYLGQPSCTGLIWVGHLSWMPAMTQFQHRRWTISAASLKSDRSNTPAAGRIALAQAHAASQQLTTAMGSRAALSICERLVDRSRYSITGNVAPGSDLRHAPQQLSVADVCSGSPTDKLMVCQVSIVRSPPPSSTDTSTSKVGREGVVESRMGAVSWGLKPPLRFPSPHVGCTLRKLPQDLGSKSTSWASDPFLSLLLVANKAGRS